MSNENPDPHPLAPGVVEAVIGRPWPVIGAAVAGLAVAVAVTLALLPERYTATATATIADPKQAAFDAGGSITADYERFLSATAGFADSTPVMTAAAQQLGHLDAEQLADHVSITPDVAARSLKVTATATTAEAAAARANAVIEAFDGEHAAHLRARTDRTLAALDEQIDAARMQVEDSQALQVQVGEGTSPTSLEEATALVTTLQERRVELTVNATAYGSGVEFIESAEQPAAPSSPDKTINGAVGLLLGTLAGMGYVWFRADRQRILASSESPQALIDVPLLGKIPEFPADAEVLSDPTAMPAEEYQFVASALDARIVGPRRVVLVGGVGRGVGTTVTAANLAVAAARDDLTVAVVDACTDEALGALFGQKPMQAGLLDLLSSRDGAVDRQRLTWALGPVSVGSRSVRLLSVGVSSRSSMTSQLRSRAAQDMFDELASRFDLVIVDCGSVSDSATTGALARSADALVLVIPNGSPSDPVIEVRERLAVERVPVAGYVFSRADRSERRRFRTANLRAASPPLGGHTTPAHTAIGPAAPAELPHAPPAHAQPSEPDGADHAPATGSHMNGVRAWPMPAAEATAGADVRGTAQ